jgi:NAD(P)-dependent dehydrogenase (short-subunit alcohol dehydrogenase family)
MRGREAGTLVTALFDGGVRDKIDVDLWSVLYGIGAFMPLTKRRGRGRVTSTASTVGLQVTPGIGP